MPRQIPMLFFSLFTFARITVELSWTTETLTTTSCKGKNKSLIWNFTEGENEKIIQFQWYFNKTTLMCLFSLTLGFHVSAAYENKVAQDGRAGIVLKNLSLYDTGEYTLYPKIAEEKIRNAQTIFLTVIEAPLSSCKPTIEIHPENVVSCSTASCGGSHSSPEWIINGTRELVSNGRYLAMNSSLTGKTVLCCQHGMNCHDGDQLQFCTLSPISFKEDIPFKTNIRPRSEFESFTVKASISEGNETMSKNVPILAGLAVALTLVVVILILIAYVTWRRYKSGISSYNVSNTAEQVSEEAQPLRTITERTEVFRPQDSNATEGLKEGTQPPRTASGPTVVSSNNSNAAEHVTEDIQSRQRIAELADRSPIDSSWGQNIQIVNNINMDSDVLKCILETQRVLMSEYKAAREENRKIKEQLLRIKHSRGERAIEMTLGNSSDLKHDDMDMWFTTSEFEDGEQDVDTTLNYRRGFISSWNN